MADDDAITWDAPSQGTAQNIAVSLDKQGVPVDMIEAPDGTVTSRDVGAGLPTAYIDKPQAPAGITWDAPQAMAGPQSSPADDQGISWDAAPAPAADDSGDQISRHIPARKYGSAFDSTFDKPGFAKDVNDALNNLGGKFADNPLATASGVAKTAVNGFIGLGATAVQSLAALGGAAALQGGDAEQGMADGQSPPARNFTNDVAAGMDVAGKALAPFTAMLSNAAQGGATPLLKKGVDALTPDSWKKQTATSEAAAGDVMALQGKSADAAGDANFEAYGSPLYATMMKTSVTGLEYLLGLRTAEPAGVAEAPKRSAAETLAAAANPETMDGINNVDMGWKDRAESVAPVITSLLRGGHAEEAIAFAGNATEAIKTGQPIDVSPASLARDVRTDEPIEGSVSQPRPGQKQLPAPTEPDVGQAANEAATPPAETPPPAPPAVPREAATEAATSADVGSPEQVPTSEKPATVPVNPDNAQDTGHTASAIAVDQANPEASATAIASAPLTPVRGEVTKAAPTASQIAIDPANVLGSLQAIAAAPVTPVGRPTSAPDGVPPEVHAAAAGNVTGIMLHIADLTRQAKVTPPAQRVAIEDQIVTLRREAHAAIAAHGAQYGGDAGLAMHTLAAESFHNLKGSYKPAVPAVQEPSAVSDGVMRLADGNVTAHVIGTPGQGASIYEWSSNNPGGGHTATALRELKARYGEITVQDPGSEGSASMSYWRAMQAKGLVDNIVDADGGKIEGPTPVGEQPGGDAGARQVGSQEVERGISWDAPAGARVVPGTIDEAAHQAAASPHNDLIEASNPQAQAGNYRKGHANVGGLNVSIENPAGSVRVDKHNVPPQWARSMEGVHYGYIRGTQGADLDARGQPQHIDVMVKAGLKDPANYQGLAFVVDQVNPKTGAFDEHKIVVGNYSLKDAKAAYLAQYEPGWNGLGHITPTTMPKLREWLKAGDTTKPFWNPDIPINAQEQRGSASAGRGEKLQASLGEIPEHAHLVTQAPAEIIVQNVPGVRAMAPHEQAGVAALIKSVLDLGVPPVLLDGLTPFTVRDAPGTLATHIVVNGVRTIALSEESVAELTSYGPTKSIHGATATTVHELWHELTVVAHKTSIEDSSPLVRMSQREGFGGGHENVAQGPIIAEARIAYLKHGNDFMAYPMAAEFWGDQSLPSTFFQRETMAQLHAMWYADNDTMAEQMPLAHALFERIENGIKSANTIWDARKAVKDILVADNVKAGPSTGVAESAQRATGKGSTGDNGSGEAGDRPVPGRAGSDRVGRRAYASELGSEPPLGKNVSVDDVARHFDELARARGGPFDYNNPKHFKAAVKQATAEFGHQLKQARSGLDWYEGDIKSAYEITAKHIPELEDAVHRQLFSVVAALMSPEIKANKNWTNAAEAYQHYVKTGSIPEVNPLNNELWSAKTGRIKAQALTHVNAMLDDMGREAAVEWLLADHSVAELNDLKQKYGVYKTRSVAGKMADRQLGVYIFGEKVGPFALNLNGINTEVTVDKWMTRTFNRYFGTLADAEGKSVEVPSEPQRRAIKELVNQTAAATGYKPSQVQSVLWFYEQQLYNRLGAGSVSTSFSDGAKDFANANEPETAGPGHDEGGSGTASPAASPGQAAATIHDFSEDPEAALKKPGWAILTAHRDGISAQANTTARNLLIADLKAGGIEHYPIAGSYKGKAEPESRLAFTTPDKALALAKKYGQESILTSKGLEYTDGRLQPADHAQTLTGEGAEDRDFHSVLPNGTAFSMGLHDMPDVDISESRAPFHSGLERAITAKAPFAKDGTVSAEQLRAWLAGRAKDGVVKPQELAWSGLDDYLKLEGGKVTRDQVQKFLDQNGVKVEETELGKPMSVEEARELLLANGVTQHYLDMVGDHKTLEDAKRYDDDQPEYADRVLPGGKNYRELLLTLPKAPDSVIHYPAEGPYQARSVVARTPYFESSHFTQPNILAHIRFNERTDANGKRVLFIEELQSDWAQTGRKQGFAGPALTQAEKDEHAALIKKGFDTPGGLPMHDIGRLHAIEWKAKNGDNKIPNAPFVGKTEAWTALALKRMIRYAAENGFDRVAWTNGEQQAARYDISQHIDKVTYTDGVLRAYKNRTAVIDQVAKPEELPGIIGKEAAEKLMAAQEVKKLLSPRDSSPASVRTISGLDLKVGGEGMKAFYDKIVPNVANDVLKKLGGGKVGEVAINAPHGPDSRYEGPTHSVDEVEKVYRALKDGEPVSVQDQVREVWKEMNKGRSFQDAMDGHASQRTAELFGGESVRGVQPEVTQQGFDITPALRERATVDTMESFSRRPTAKTEAVVERPPLTGLPKSSPGPFEPARAVADMYMREVGLPYDPPTNFVRVDPMYAKRIAFAYDMMGHAPRDAAVAEAYQALADETIAQWHAMKTTGIDIRFADSEHPYPYAVPSEAVADVRDNGRLWVYPTDEGFGSSGKDVSDNPLLAKTDIKVGGRQLMVNDVFRAVHDYFGHVKEGLGFRADGEENAWRQHAAMFSPLAREAMTSETRGQNSWLNYGPHGEANRTAKQADTIYADQKAGLLPKEFTEDRYADAGRESAGRGQQVAEGRPEVTVSESRRPGLDDSVAREPPPPADRGIGDAFRRWLAPSTRGPLAEREAGIIRHNLAKQARDRELAFEQLKDFGKMFYKMPRPERYAFIDAMEHGLGRSVNSGNPVLTDAAQAIADLLDNRRHEIAALGTGKLENFIVNYFPHIWQDRQRAATFFGGRRPLEGPKNFLKQRHYTDFMDGIEAGLKPITSNPVELALLKAREMDRYLYGQRIAQASKDAGLWRLLPWESPMPEGFTAINDKIAMGGSAGRWVAPDEAARLINNHLSPGLQGNSAYRAIRSIGNMLNSAQLGLSAFHVGFTTADSMISKSALGVMQLSRGDVGEGLGNIAQGMLNPAQPFINLYKGDKLLRAYLGDMSDPNMTPIVRVALAAGTRVRMDDFYRNGAVKDFRQALQEGQYVRAGRAFLPSVMDAVMWPVMQWLVPRQKLGVFFDLAKDLLEQHPDMTDAEMEARAGRLWDSVDNRLGQMVYDNIFWDRAIKDIAMVSVRSVGWNWGTFRELGGGIKDLLDVKAIKKEGGISSRTAYFVALVATTALWGAIINYLYTGQGPKEIKDYFFPRTGKTRADGSVDRVSLPTYMKDVASYGHDIGGFLKYGADPTQTLRNKMAPQWSMLNQMLTNKDFFGAAIRSPGDPAVKQLLGEAKFIGSQAAPMGVRNYLQQSKTAGTTPNALGYVTSPSFIGITPSPGYITKSDAQTESSAISNQKDALMAKFRQEIRDGEPVSDVHKEMRDAGLTATERSQVVTQASRPQHPPKTLRQLGQ